MQKTPKGFRLHIGLFGRRNAGKSSVLNALTRQAVSIVSDVAGTTTDPVEKPMELLPIGPCLFIDTAGIDDAGSLGEKRVEATRRVFDRTDVGLVVAAGGEWGDFEEEVLAELLRREIPAVAVFNKADLGRPASITLASLARRGAPCVETVATDGEGLLDLREAVIAAAPEEFINTPTILGDLVKPGRLAMLVVPIDLEAPKGRLILAQVQTIRDVLDNDACCMIVKERDLAGALARLREPPALVVTDSQAFAEVARDTPDSVPLTGFSILFARFKGDLCEFVRGAVAIERLRPGDRVLVAEACSHHPIGEDIGRVKITRWLQEYAGGELDFTHTQGHDFPDNLASFQLVAHCGSCMWNRREVLSRIVHCRRAGVPIANYGMAIAYSLGIFERALRPFPAALATYHELPGSGKQAEQP